MLFTNLNQAREVVEKINLNTLIDRYNSLSTNYDGKITIAIIAHATAADLCKKLRYSLESILIDIVWFNGKAIKSQVEEFYKKYNVMVVISGTRDLSFDKMNFDNTIKNYKDAGFRIEVYTNSSLLKCSAARKLAVDYCKSEYIQFVDVGDGLYFKNFEKAIENTQRRFWNVTHSPVYIEDKNLYHTGNLKEMQNEGESFGESCNSCNPDYSDKASKFDDCYGDLMTTTQITNEDGGMNETTFEFSNLNKTHGKFKVGKRLTRYNSYIGLRADRFSGEDFNELNARRDRYSSYFGGERSERYSSYEPDRDEPGFENDGDRTFTYLDRTFVRGLARGLNNISLGQYNMYGVFNESNEDQIVATLRQPTVLSFLMNRNLLKVTYELMSKFSLHVNMGEDMITHFIYRTINNKMVKNHYDELSEKNINYSYRESTRDINQININWHGYYLYTSHMDSMCRDLDEYGKKSKTYENELKSVILFLYAMGYEGEGEHEDTIKVLLAEKLLNLNGIQIDIESLHEHTVEPKLMDKYHSGELQRNASDELRSGIRSRIRGDGGSRSCRYNSYFDESDPERLIKVNIDEG